MAQFGELFGPGKLRKESSDDQGTGDPFEPGSLDLDAGVIRIRAVPKKPVTPEESEE
ncbi:hypothetical protein LWC34_16910 [Kibdelosporangium philippinense]|uniref:Uncharacterized protein n=1 Tax=Kibdelosporangium philippinense TaxID=211113 RepID=A0ABS8ZAG1_9PSEU|nr:hypothetical protein [Kibdelosporangium philippinense]MCE7004502.1 hypothetical protein [Kibdelosporangium philippinense]